MSIETEIKKLTAAQVQNTDAIVQLTSVLEAYVVSTTGQIKTPVSSVNDNMPAPAPIQQPVPAPAPIQEPAPAAVPTPEPGYTFDQVNQILGSIALNMNDNGVAVRALMKEYNADVLNQVPQDKYSEIITRAQELQS